MEMEMEMEQKWKNVQVQVGSRSSFSKLRLRPLLGTHTREVGDTATLVTLTRCRDEWDNLTGELRSSYKTIEAIPHRKSSDYSRQLPQRADRDSTDHYPQTGSTMWAASPSRCLAHCLITPLYIGLVSLHSFLFFSTRSSRAFVEAGGISTRCLGLLEACRVGSISVCVTSP